jgi:hypothetical protein
VSRQGGDLFRRHHLPEVFRLPRGLVAFTLEP